ncbi:hypothetical protein MRB53_038833 [Persea americana]|nr:hypothetical protein MRB53_038833 [Persea americana]
MPGIIEPYDDLTGAVQQIRITSINSYHYSKTRPSQNQVQPLIQALTPCPSSDREAEIERICNTNHQEFINSVNQLQSVREGTVNLTSEIMELSRSIEASTEKLAGTKTSTRRKSKAHYAALRALDELQNVHLREVTRFKIAEMIERSVPATQKLIAEAVMTDLQHVALSYSRDFTISWRDEDEEFDVLNNEEVKVDFDPLFECLHIHEALGQTDKFRSEYAATLVVGRKSFYFLTHSCLTMKTIQDCLLCLKA